MGKYELDQWSRMDITKIRKESLADIRVIKLDTFAPVDERFSSFLNQIRNPYCFLYGSTPVRISFSDENHTLQERLKRYFMPRKRG